MLTLDQLRIFCGTPTEVDGVPLTEQQANFLARSVSRLVGEAEHPFDRAVELSTRAFRASFELRDGRWEALREVPLSGGRKLGHCFNRTV